MDNGDNCTTLVNILNDTEFYTPKGLKRKLLYVLLQKQKKKGKKKKDRHMSKFKKKKTKNKTNSLKIKEKRGRPYVRNVLISQEQ